MHRRTLTLFFLLLAVPLFAQTSHIVSRIVVLGKVPAQIVVSQTALAEGSTYTERDLEIAVSRIRRLPFVYAARYSMDGETMIIEVDAVTRFFAGVDLSGASFTGNATGVANVGGGARLFLGAGGVAEATVNKVMAEGGNARTFGAEYAYYGIGGTRLFAIGGIESAFINDDHFEPTPTWNVTVGYPLTPRQTLSVSAFGEGFRSERRPAAVERPLVSESDRRTLNLRWSFDTTDDPFFARHGEAIHVTPSWTREDSLFEAFAATFPTNDVQIFTSRSDGSTAALGLDARKLWAIGGRGAIFTDLNASRDRLDVDVQFNDEPVQALVRDSNAASVTVGYAHNFFDSSAAMNSLRHRVEIGFRASRRTVEQPGPSSATFDSTGVLAAWTMRLQFMNVRLSFAYDSD